MANPLWSELDSLLEQRQKEGLERRRPTWVAQSPRSITADDGCRLVHFGSNDYLCLSWNGSNRIALQSQPNGLGWGKDRFGAGASPSVSGNTPYHSTLVKELARFTESEDAILFPSGYAANMGTIAALASESDVIFSDRLNHASLIDGCRLSKARIMVYPHGDMHELEKLIQMHRDQAKHGFIVTDSVFSMDGDLADLPRIMKLCEQFDLTAIVDEAHATGVYGGNGGGLVQHFGLTTERIVKIGTLSKAIGSVGGFVAGPKVLIRWLINFARPYVYSTSLPIPVVRFASQSIGLIQKMESERVRLRHAASQLRESLREIGHRVGEGNSPIVSIYAPSVETVLDWSVRLRREGFFVPAIRPPTVPRDGSLLRVSLNLSHTEADLQSLTEACRF